MTIPPTWIAAYGLLVSVLAPIAFGQDSSIPPDEQATTAVIREVARHGFDASLGIVRFDELVVVTQRRSPGGESEFRAKMKESLDAARARAWADMAERTGIDERVLEDEARVPSLDIDLDEVMRRRAADSFAEFERTALIDFAQQRMRLDVRDLRDLSKLAQDWQLSEMTRRSMDRTCVQVRHTDYAVDMPDQIENYAVVAPLPRFIADEQALRFGILPAWVADERVVLVADRDGTDERALFAVRGSECDAHSTFRISVDTRIGLRVRRLEVYDALGAREWTFEAEDYREIDGVWIPFRTELRRTLDGDPDGFVEERFVRSVSFPKNVSDDFFEIPPGYRVDDWRESALRPTHRPAIGPRAATTRDEIAAVLPGRIRAGVFENRL